MARHPGATRVTRAAAATYITEVSGLARVRYSLIKVSSGEPANGQRDYQSASDDAVDLCYRDQPLRSRDPRSLGQDNISKGLGRTEIKVDVQR